MTTCLQITALAGSLVFLVAGSKVFRHKAWNSTTLAFSCTCKNDISVKAPTSREIAMLRLALLASVTSCARLSFEYLRLLCSQHRQGCLKQAPSHQACENAGHSTTQNGFVHDENDTVAAISSQWIPSALLAVGSRGMQCPTLRASFGLNDSRRFWTICCPEEVSKQQHLHGEATRSH